jgi:8-oxo-(d)GTP phosphatase
MRPSGKLGLLLPDRRHAVAAPDRPAEVAGPARIEVEAAGGVLWRPGQHGEVELLLVHRPRSRDWSFPKGKLDPGETAIGAALREVREETGLRCTVDGDLGETRYVDRKGRSKRVRYWAMQPAAGRFRRNTEVDKVRWVPLDEVLHRLTYGHDRAFVARSAADLVALAGG